MTMLATVAAALLCLGTVCSADRITEFKSQPSTVNEGGTVKITCMADDWWNTCELSHIGNGNKCQMTTKEDGWTAKMGPCSDSGRMKGMVESYKRGNFECTFELSAMTLSDHGNWRCKMNMYSTRNAIQTSWITVMPEYKVNLKASPSVDINEGEAVNFTCTSSHEWKTCSLEHDGKRCSWPDERNDNEDEQLDEQCKQLGLSPIGSQTDNNRCVFQLEEAKMEHAGEWNCSLVMKHDEKRMQIQEVVTITPKAITPPEDEEPTDDLTTPDNPTTEKPTQKSPSKVEGADQGSTPVVALAIASGVAAVIIIALVVFFVMRRKMSAGKDQTMKLHNEEKSDRGNHVNEACSSA